MACWFGLCVSCERLEFHPFAVRWAQNLGSPGLPLSWVGAVTAGLSDKDLEMDTHEWVSFD